MYLLKKAFRILVLKSTPSVAGSLLACGAIIIIFFITPLVMIVRYCSSMHKIL